MSPAGESRLARFSVTVDTGWRDSNGHVVAERHRFNNLGDWARFWAARVADGTACRCYVQSFRYPAFDNLVSSAMDEG
ncbi:MAG TPA: hypothetical protein VH280_02615 [Verrucomicrobiae bacterium]|nr:hypothetical protein [Verrucomicrobiae bacterium]